ncbi:MAG TPA: VTT domain-containing protein [Candidatus Kapabacteria bacterium]|nr:VTT domain-containing protein [Candidatus Kapabacteria bacterium]
MHEISSLFHTLSSPVGLEHLVNEGGMLMLAIIIFAENGVLAGFFLPGDSLLITAGILIGGHRVAIEFLPLAGVLTLAAIAGETVGYYIGKTAGQKLYQRPNSRLFKREHLERAHKFYEKHGGKTIVLARFIPIIRTFVPVVAGAAEMDIKRFTMFNIAGGLLWVCGVMLIGLLLGASVKNIGNYIYLIIGIVIVLSMLPPVIEFLRNRARRSGMRSGAQEE